MRQNVFVWSFLCWLSEPTSFSIYPWRKLARHTHTVQINSLIQVDFPTSQYTDVMPPCSSEAEKKVLKSIHAVRLSHRSNHSRSHRFFERKFRISYRLEVRLDTLPCDVGKRHVHTCLARFFRNCTFTHARKVPLPSHQTRSWRECSARDKLTQNNVLDV